MRGYAAIGIYAPKNTINFGGTLRAAMCYNAALIILDTPRFKNWASDTTNAEKHIPTIVGGILDHRPHNCPLIVIELLPEAKSLTTFTHPERAFYVFGPEDGNVPKSIINKAQHVVSIPTRFCMNLAATVNVVLYDRLLKSG